MTHNSTILSMADDAAFLRAQDLREERRIQKEISGKTERRMQEFRAHTESLLKEFKPYADDLEKGLNVIVLERLGSEFSVQQKKVEDDHLEVNLMKGSGLLISTLFLGAGERGDIKVIENGGGEISNFNIRKFGSLWEPNPKRTDVEKILDSIVSYLTEKGHYPFPAEECGKQSAFSRIFGRRTRTPVP